ncbi:MAG: DUF2384 domain-containing protein [Rhizobiales bacterium]|nr:DUF2384 domain-containing protein [Hyphomicrobiales bacterium]
MSYHQELEIVGGEAIVGHAVRSRRDLVDAVRGGLPIGTIEHVVASGRLSLAEVDAVVLPRKTLSHRKTIGTLTPDQSDRLMRAAGIIATAEEIFGSKEKAGRWLRRPTTALDGEAPIALLDTAQGTLIVRDLLARIDHGLAA